MLLALTAVAVSWASAEMVTMRLGQAPKAGPAAGPDVPRGQPPTAYVPRTKQGPTLDGKLDEGIWEKAATLQLARTLDGGAGAAQPTAVKLLRDDKMLYVGVQAFEPLMSKLQATRRGHDGPVWDDDSIEMFLGTGGVYWHFGVNAVGSTYDGRGKDASWNCGFQAAAGRGKSEYVLEVAIPLIQMAGRAELPTDWIANFNRNRRVTGSLQEAAWSPTYSGDSHLPDRFGRLLLKEPPEPEPGKAPEKPVLRKQDVEILPAANGAGVVRFELSKLPGRARVYRADLLVFRTTQVDGRMDEAMVDIEIYPLFSAFKAGGTARASGKPAAVRGPWYDRFDVTEAVKKWVSGAANGGFFFKACPFWNAEAPCLDVWYQGRPQDVPPQVTGVEALHHAGQTFITWKEIADPVGRDEVKSRCRAGTSTAGTSTGRWTTTSPRPTGS
ncbi:MAG: hypothetical protein AMJ81_07220 [Phycisphaerae bacterium SM23_33]|nr:MAG: hypothetical protein AMJ81_07220 [Phycisphaerae bacterium SM23_33]